MLINNVSIRTKSPELVEFFYPNYFKTSSYSPFIEGGVIFDGDSKYLQSFRDSGIPYIYTKGTPEYDLTIPENLLNFVYKKWDKNPPSYMLDYFNSFDKVNDELEEQAKLIWVNGKSYIQDNEENEMNMLYSVIARSPLFDIISKFLEISSNTNTDKLFYRIQRFLKMTNDVNNIKSVKTRKNVESFIGGRGKENIENALMSYLYSPADNIELKLIKLFDALTVSKW